MIVDHYQFEAIVSDSQPQPLFFLSEQQEIYFPILMLKALISFFFAEYHIQNRKQFHDSVYNPNHLGLNEFIKYFIPHQPRDIFH